MATPETLVKIKQALRISHSKLDEDIQADIDACLADLQVHGITGPKAVEADPLIYNAIKLYCRALYTDDTGKAAEWRAMYQDLRAHLKSAKGYGWTGEVAADD